ncbi:MAG: hypothetical protein ACYCX7_08725 [Solirubrobacteraceae bacterium]
MPFAIAAGYASIPFVQSAIQPELLLARIVDPFGHEWELGRPLRQWPPATG